MLFTTEEGSKLPHGRVVYVRQDYALNFVPSHYSDCSVLIGDVELGFGWFYSNSKCAIQVSGY